MDNNVRVNNIEDVIERMKFVPEGAQTAVSPAINDALRRGCTEMEAKAPTRSSGR
jgi:hypothetical protein